VIQRRGLCEADATPTPAREEGGIEVGSREGPRDDGAAVGQVIHASRKEYLLSRSRIRTAVLAGVTSLAVGAGLVTSLGPIASNASSHREAPLTAADPQIDNTDLYAFVSPDRSNTVTFVSSWIPFEEPAGGPNFFLWAEHTNYDINIDNDGDAKAEIVYRWKFTTHYRSGDTFLYNTGQVTSLDDADLNIYQTYDLYRIKSGTTKRLIDDAPVVPSRVGDASMPNYHELFAEGTTSYGAAPAYSWVGQSDDAFFLDLRVFDLLYGADLSERGDDTLAGFNVNTMALQVPKAQLRGPKDGVLGIWNTASRPSMRVQKADGTQAFSGSDVQVSRLGNPLVNEVVVPLAFKDYFNGSKPTGDAAYLPKVQDPELPHLLNLVYGTDVPDSNPDKAGIQRADLIQVFLTGVPGLNQPTDVVASEMLRLNMDIPPCTDACSRLGVLGGDLAGYPNGRRLSDDVIDEALRVILGVLLPDHQAIADTIGDGVDANDKPFGDAFPYVATPHPGSDTSPH
jgi:hypothetical protein